METKSENTKEIKPGDLKYDDLFNYLQEANKKLPMPQSSQPLQPKNWGEYLGMYIRARWDMMRLRLNSEALHNFAATWLWPFRMAWVHSRLLAVMVENRFLRLQLKAAAKGLVQKHSVQPGDILVFLLDECDEDIPFQYIGHSFGIGWAALTNIQRYVSIAAGGPVQTMASQTDSINLSVLNKAGRNKLRATIDAADRNEKTLEFPLQRAKMPAVYDRETKRWRLFSRDSS